MYVPVHHADHSTRASRELTQRIELAVRDYRTEHPKTSAADVQVALRAVLAKAGTRRRHSVPQSLGLGAGLSILFGAAALIARMLEGDERSLVVLFVAAFVIAALIVVLLLARRNG